MLEFIRLKIENFQQYRSSFISSKALSSYGNATFQFQSRFYLLYSNLVILLSQQMLFLPTGTTASRSSRPEVFLTKNVLKICIQFTEEHPCRIVISIKILCNFIEITLQHGCSPINLLHIFRTSFPKNTSG